MDGLENFEGYVFLRAELVVDSGLTHSEAVGDHLQRRTVHPVLGE